MPTSHSSALRRSLLITEEFRKINPHFPMHMASMLLLIAQSPGISLREVAQRLGFGKSSVNKDASILANGWGNPLITYGRDPADARNNICRLTPHGQRLVDSIVVYIQG